MSGTVYKRKGDERWVGCVNLPAENGKRKRLYVYADTERDAKRLYNELLYNVEHGLFKPNDGTTLLSLLNKWYEIHKPKLAETTQELYRMYIDKHIGPQIGATKLKNLKPLVLDQFYNERLTYLYRGKPLSPNTVIKLHKLLHEALRYAVKNDLLVSNPADNVSLPQHIAYKPKIYNEDNFNNLLAEVAGTYDEIPILLAGAVGLRRGEIFGLRWRDIDFKAKTITIVKTKVRYNKKITKAPKSEASSRTIKVYDFVLDVLKIYRDASKLVPEYVCDKYAPTYYSERFRNLLKKHELPKIRLHDLRHYNAIIMLKYGVSDKIAAERLGHSDTTMLKKVYQHVLSEMHDEAAAKIETAMAGKSDSQIDSQTAR